MTTTLTPPCVLFTEATVVAITRCSPSVMRVWFASPRFAELANPGFDTRIKVVLPAADGSLLTPTPASPEEWYAEWLELPDACRPPIRTYTIRAIEGHGARTRLVVDFVLHSGGDLGPACRWALTASVGDVVQIVGPHARTPGYGGTEFDPAGRRDLLLVGDDTALPAIMRIIADLGPGYTGTAFVEVGDEDDVVPIELPAGLRVHWVVRDRAHGRRLVADVRRHLGLGEAVDPESDTEEVAAALDTGVWETPGYSATGEDLLFAPNSFGNDLADTYAWIAGESWLVRNLRRVLVGELGMDRAQVAFMGYWREGVAMKS